MSFDRVLRDVIEEDDGLLLRVTAYQRMMEARPAPRGWAARTLDALRRRSWKIFATKGGRVAAQHEE